MSKVISHPFFRIHHISQSFNRIFSIPLFLLSVFALFILLISIYELRILWAILINIFFNRPKVYFHYYSKIMRVFSRLVIALAFFYLILGSYSILFRIFRVFYTFKGVDRMTPKPTTAENSYYQSN